MRMMRETEEIEREMEGIGNNGTLTSQNRLLLEVLLDIRQLLLLRTEGADVECTPTSHVEDDLRRELAEAKAQRDHAVMEAHSAVGMASLAGAQAAAMGRPGIKRSYPHPAMGVSTSEMYMGPNIIPMTREEFEEIEEMPTLEKAIQKEPEKSLWQRIKGR